MHLCLDVPEAFTIPLICKSLTPLVVGYIAPWTDINRMVQLHFDNVAMRPCLLGAFMLKVHMPIVMGMVHPPADQTVALCFPLLPASLRWLYFDPTFEQELPPGCLPALCALVFPDDMDLGHTIPHVCPSKWQLADLRDAAELGSRFNNTLSIGALPASLTILSFGSYSHFNQFLQPGVLFCLRH